MIEALIVLASAAAGFMAKSTWEAHVSKKKDLEVETWRIRVGELARRLSEFYWPIYLRLQRDNVVWACILERGNKDDLDRSALGQKIEDDVLIPNHSQIIGILETKMHLAGSDRSFEEQVLAYLRHVEVYRAIRTAGIVDKDPIAFEEPYPHEFFKQVQGRLHRFQAEYDEALKSQGVA